MRLHIAVLAAIFTLAPVTWNSNQASMVLIKSAFAEELPAVWQRKLKQISKNVTSSRDSLATRGVEDLKDSFKAKQWRERIVSYQTSLSRVPASTDPLLAATQQALAALISEFNALQGSAAAQPAQPATQASQAADDNTAETNTIAATTPTPSSNKPELVSGQRVRVKKLTRDMQSTTDDIVISGPSPMQSAEVVSRYQNALKRYAEALGRYAEYQHDADVRTAAGTYQTLATALRTEFERAKSQLQELGDIQDRLAAVEASLRQQEKPAQLFMPFSEAIARQWVHQLSQSQNAAQRAITELQAVMPLAYLPETRGTPQQGALYDRQDVDRLLRSATSLQTNVNSAVSETQAYLKHQFDHQDQHSLTYFRNLDPASDKDRMNAYLADGAEGEILERLDREMAMVQSVAAYQRAFGKEPTDNTIARIDEIAILRKKYLADRAEVLGGYKLPDPVSDDASRLEIAERILNTPEYEFGEYGPIVLTTPNIITREKEVSRDTIRDVDVSLSGTITLSGTRESWQYKWDEFKFAAPLKETDSDEWYVWWITAKKYQSGWERTPIGVWVSGSSTKGSLILEQNFR